LPASARFDIIAALAELGRCFCRRAECKAMLFDFGWSEILLIGMVALVFIGPKDLPKALRLAGFWVRKARTLSREFQGSIDQMIREAELDEIRQDLKKASEFDLDKEFHNTIDPTGSLSESLKPPELSNFSRSERSPPADPEAAVEAVPRPSAEAPAPLEPAPAGTAPSATPEPASPEPPASPDPPASRQRAPAEPGPAAGAPPGAVAADVVPPTP
jgi:sec-independent protein translocase protein TatB